MSLSRKLISLVLCVLLLNGCGFRFPQSYHLGEKYQQLYLTSSNEFSPLTRAVRSRLAQYGVSVIGMAEANTPTLTLKNEEYATRTLSLYSDGETAEYELSYTVRCSLTVPNGDPKTIEVLLHRDFINNTQEALAEQREIELIETELRTMAVDQIIRELATVEI
jgi:LPS-assembly lipoprotein